MKTIKALLISLILFNLSACDKLFVPDNPDNNHLNNFNLLWKTVNEKYCFFSYKSICWDSIYDVYSPKINNEMSDVEFFYICADMLNELKDGHVNLWAPFNTSRYWDWYLNYPQNFNATIVERYYLGKNHLMAGGLKVQKVRQDIGYIRYESFMNSIGSSFLDFILALFNEETKGLIIDVRNNGGGYVHLTDTFASRFVKEGQVLVGYNQYKKGPGHDHFTKLYPYYLNAKGTYYRHPVVVLTNRLCYSSANQFVSYMSALPNVILMGDRTGGGSGEPIGYELYNGWMLRLSINPSFNVNKEQIEFGISPDIPSSIEASDEADNIDTMIEDAIQYLQNL